MSREARRVRTSGFRAKPEMHPTPFFSQPFGKFNAGDLVLDAVRRERFFRQLEECGSCGWQLSLAAGSDGEIERFQELATEEHFDVSAVNFLQAPIARGFVFPAPHSRSYRTRSCSGVHRRFANGASPIAVSARSPAARR